MTAEQRRIGEVNLIHQLRSVQRVISASSVGVFIAHDGEPNLQPLIDELWKRGQSVALPMLVDDPTDTSMRFVPWFAGEQLIPGRYGIAEPPDPDRPSIEPDVILVSLTAFDATGGRMGRGGGFFDRYLENSASLIVGVGFEVQRVDLVPVEPHDVTLPVVATDLGVRFVVVQHESPRVRRKRLNAEGIAL